MDMATLWQQIGSHPLASRHRLRCLWRAAAWRWAARGGATAKFALSGCVQLRAALGMHGVTGNIYLGLIEFEPCLFAAHLLRPGELFLDGGAHHGTFALLVAAHAQARVVAVEPQPRALVELRANITLNHLEQRIQVVEAALGANLGRTRLDGQGATAHVRYDQLDGGCEVAMSTIDLIAHDHGVPTLAKLDLEGFEALAVRGAQESFASADFKALVIETNGLTKHYGMTTTELLALLADYGFKRAAYDPLCRRLSKDNTEASTSLLVKDWEWAQQRLCDAAPVKVLGEAL